MSSDIHDYSQKMKSEPRKYKHQLEGQSRIETECAKQNMRQQLDQERNNMTMQFKQDLAKLEKSIPNDT